MLESVRRGLDTSNAQGFGVHAIFAPSVGEVSGHPTLGVDVVCSPSRRNLLDFDVLAPPEELKTHGMLRLATVVETDRPH